MANKGAFRCFESGHWDHHDDVNKEYAAPKEVYQDMYQPLSHYFVSSGHNSYLTGNQLSSSSGVKTINACLDQGCRVIELDVYNGSGSGDPVCKHGGTMTSAVSVRKCVRAIKDHAFTKSPYPVIITIENHTTGEHQKRLADVIRHELGEALFVPPADKPGKGWHSPEELKKRVLVRTTIKEGLGNDLRAIIYIENTKFKGFGAMKEMDKCFSFSIGESKAATIIDSVLPRAKSKEGTNLLGLGNLGTIMGAGGKSSGKDSSKRGSPQRALDVQATVGSPGNEGGEEEEAEAAGASNALMASLEDVWQQTSRHLMRVYPAGWRVDSANYDPTDAWNVGTSFAALNWQRWDKPLWVNQGKFMDNGGCGYVLKPEWMRNPAPPMTTSSGRVSDGGTMGKLTAGREAKVLRVHVFSGFRHQGWNMLCYKDDVYAEIEIKGMPCDKQKHQTNRIHNSGRLLVEKSFDVPVYYPEMAVLILSLKDHDTGVLGDYLGYSSLPLATLQPGSYKLLLNKPSGKKPTARAMWLKVQLSWVELEESQLNPISSMQPLLRP